jgi:hypothetical protein
MDIVDALLTVTATLDDAGIPYAICGGIAVTLHGATRSTKDIDLLVRAPDVEPIVDALRPLGWRFRAIPMTFDQGTPAQRRVHRISRVVDDQVFIVDLLEVGDLFQEAFDTRIALPLGDAVLYTVSLDGLTLLKRMAGRPQDIADLEKLGVTDE